MPRRKDKRQVPPVPLAKLAEAPFDNAGADLILQSSDEVHFHVFKNIISIASPVFAVMFSLPLPPSGKQLRDASGVQVVSLSEHSTALDIALRHIYPVRTPKGDKLHYASILSEFARKYQVEALDRIITGYLVDSIERDPVGVYAIAATNGYNDIGANAARSCLNLPFSGIQSSYLRCATAEHILELVKYHVDCGKAASDIASSDRTWFSSLATNGIFALYSNEATTSTSALQRSAWGPVGSLDGATQPCSCTMPDFLHTSKQPKRGVRSDNRIRSGPRYLWNYLYRSALVLAHHPSAEAITKEDFVVKSNDCHSCARYMRGHMLGLSVVLGGEIKKAVEQVSLSLYPLSCL
jgi:BTB/POZ domain